MEDQNERSTIAQPGQIVFLGHQGENLARQVIFDLSDLRERYPEGRFALAAQRKGDALPYPAARTNLDGDALVWTLTDADTAVAGYGRCELRCYDGDTLAKSEVWNTFTLPALAEYGEAPAAWPDYVAQVQRIGAQVEEAQRHAPQIGETGCWQLWNAAQGTYADTGLPARGERGEQGKRGEPGPVPASAWVHKTVSGNVLAFQDGAGDAPICSLTVQIEPGSDTPLSGRHGAAVYCTGKNMLPAALPQTWKHLTAGSGVLANAKNAVTFAVPIPQNATITVQKRQDDTSGGTLSLGDTEDIAAGTPIWSVSGFSAAHKVTFQTDSHRFLYITTSDLTQAQQWFTSRMLMVSLGSIWQKYVAPKGVTVQNIDWSEGVGTLYGGTLDVTKGILTSTLDENGQPLTEPLVYEVQPAVFDTLDGENVIWADCGEAVLVFCADATRQDRSNARKAMLAATEDVMTATRNYTVGELLIAGETLYTVMANIPGGSAITPGVNVSETTVAAQIALAAASGGGDSGSVTVDAALSAESENPVQNKVIKAALAGKGTYSKPSGGIPKADLAAAVQASLGKADSALQAHQDISGKADATSVPTAASVSAAGVLSFANSAGTQLFTVQLPLYAGGVS